VSNCDIYFNPQAQVVPWKLWVSVAGLMAIDVVLLLVWTLLDPLSREVRNFPKLPSPNIEEDVEILPQLEHCKSKHHNVWLGELAAGSITSVCNVPECSE
jgi:hypothetical protein